MPDNPPERFEAGTLNFHGLAGLKASLEYIMQRGLQDIYRREQEIITQVFLGLQSIPHLVLLA